MRIVRATLAFVLSGCGFGESSEQTVARALTAESTRNERYAALAAATAVSCEFTSSYTVDWKLRPEAVGQRGNGFDGLLRFEDVDLAGRTARFVGNNGSETVSASLTDEGLHFVEQTLSGNRVYTTVFVANPGAFVPNLFAAVQSRHVAPTYPLPSQFYGTCVIR